jgi:hypothetical protein
MPRLLPVVALVAVLCTSVAERAWAQDAPPAFQFDIAAITKALSVAPVPMPVTPQWWSPPVAMTKYTPYRTSPLMFSLYAATAMTQAFDAHSTLRAIDNGAREGNPALSSLAEHRTSFLLLKAGAAAGTIYLGRRIDKHHRVMAIVSLVAVNSAYAMLIRHNYSVARSAH